MLGIEQEYIRTSPFGNFVQVFEDTNSDATHVRSDDEIGIDVDYSASLSSCQR